MMLQGNALHIPLANESVQCVVTSPPYWGLRDYKVDGQLGLETTPEAYVAAMVQVFREVRRVLRKDGVCWLNLGDSYAGSAQGWGHDGQASGPKQATNRGSLNQPKTEAKIGFERPPAYISSRQPNGLKPKDLVGIPWAVAFALRTDGWWLRSDIIWSKPNPMPESVTDRPTKAHEYLFLMSKSASYYYDHEAIKEDGSAPTTKMPDGWDTGEGAHGSFHRNGREKGKRVDKQRGHGRRHDGFNDRWDHMTHDEQCELRRNKRSVWNVATQPYPDAHFATFPEKLVEPCILAGSKAGDIVFDPFAGSGTVLSVAQRFGRRGVGLELNPAYITLAHKRTHEQTVGLAL